MDKSPDRSSPKKRQFRDEDDEIEEDVAHRSKKKESMQPASPGTPEPSGNMDGPDESFMDLIKTFAKLDFPEMGDDAPEQCPVCCQSFPLSSFLSHTMECLKSLDDIEKQEQLKLDEQLALKLSQEAHTADKDQALLMNSFTKKIFCPEGRNCTRRDVTHFIEVSHPLVECPVCSDEFLMFEINAHVTICLEKGPSSSFGNVRKAKKAEETKSAFGTSSPMKASFAVARESTATPSEEKKQKTKKKRNMRLTAKQLSVLANMVCEQTAKGSAKAEHSVVDLLETFKHLGFTRENLSRELEEQRGRSPTVVTSNSSLDTTPMKTSSSIASLRDETAPVQVVAPSMSFTTAASLTDSAPLSMSLSSSSSSSSAGGDAAAQGNSDDLE